MARPTRRGRAQTRREVWRRRRQRASPSPPGEVICRLVLGLVDERRDIEVASVGRRRGSEGRAFVLGALATDVVAPTRTLVCGRLVATGARDDVAEPGGHDGDGDLALETLIDDGPEDDVGVVVDERLEGKISITVVA